MQEQKDSRDSCFHDANMGPMERAIEERGLQRVVGDHIPDCLPISAIQRRKLATTRAMLG